mmetsp:Transcript_64676/g.115052  ORF Transcript_64676/g.115052 Transcript_64676/m.115052 type:complete len:107 (-) Transcript_64676:502-822(-)
MLQREEIVQTSLCDDLHVRLQSMAYKFQRQAILGHQWQHEVAICLELMTCKPQCGIVLVKAASTTSSSLSYARSSSKEPFKQANRTAAVLDLSSAAQLMFACALSS